MFTFLPLENTWKQQRRRQRSCTLHTTNCTCTKDVLICSTLIWFCFTGIHMCSEEKWIAYLHQEPRCKHARCHDVTLEGSPSNCCQGQPALSADSTQRYIESDSVVFKKRKKKRLLCVSGINCIAIFTFLIQINYLLPCVISHAVIWDCSAPPLSFACAECRFFFLQTYDLFLHFYKRCMLKHTLPKSWPHTLPSVDRSWCCVHAYSHIALYW